MLQHQFSDHGTAISLHVHVAVVPERLRGLTRMVNICSPEINYGFRAQVRILSTACADMAHLFPCTCKWLVGAMVAREIPNLKVVGSIPTWVIHPELSSVGRAVDCSGIARHQHVAGSIPAARILLFSAGCLF